MKIFFKIKASINWTCRITRQRR